MGKGKSLLDKQRETLLIEYSPTEGRSVGGGSKKVAGDDSGTLQGERFQGVSASTVDKEPTPPSAVFPTPSSFQVWRFDSESVESRN